ncbi:MAG: EAL domain-containing protein [Chitinivorax sp.]
MSVNTGAVHTVLPELCCEVAQIMQQRSLSAVFQPIADLRERKVFGYEGLIRGPSNSRLHSPMALFSAAGQCGCFLQLEQLCREVVVEAFVQQRLQGKLFLNVSPERLIGADYRHGCTMQAIERAGLDPHRVIIELTEHRPLYDYSLLCAAIAHYRAMGFSIAIDDLGEGFSSLRRWSELRPEFVKIDRHFVQNIHQDPLKAQFLRSIQQIAENAGARVIAEGIEILPELQLVKDLGISLGQGYVFARPSVTPPPGLPPESIRLLQPPAGPAAAGQCRVCLNGVRRCANLKHAAAGAASVSAGLVYRVRLQSGRMPGTAPGHRLA